MLEASGYVYSPGGQTDSQIGFRVLRTLPANTGDADSDDDVDLDDLSGLAANLAGPGITAGVDSAVFDFDDDGDVDLDDAAVFLVMFTGPQ